MYCLPQVEQLKPEAGGGGIPAVVQRSIKVRWVEPETRWVKTERWVEADRWVVSERSLGFYWVGYPRGAWFGKKRARVSRDAIETALYESANNASIAQ
jgi:hypothetical protein